MTLEQFYIDLARRTLECMRELRAQGKLDGVKWADGPHPDLEHAPLVVVMRTDWARAAHEAQERMRTGQERPGDGVLSWANCVEDGQPEATRETQRADTEQAVNGTKVHTPKCGQDEV